MRRQAFQIQTCHSCFDRIVPPFVICAVETGNIRLYDPEAFQFEGEMDWLDHSLRENSFLWGAVTSLALFALLRVARPTPVRTAPVLVACVASCMITAFEVMHFWPPTLGRSEILVGTFLTCFLIGFMLSRLGSITFDAATREFVFQGSVLWNALTALVTGVFVALLPLYWDKSWDGIGFVAATAPIAGSALGQWQRMVRAGGA